MGLYEVPLSTSLFVFGMRTMLANFHMCGVKGLMRSKNTSGYFSLYIDNISITTHST